MGDEKVEETKAMRILVLQEKIEGKRSKQGKNVRFDKRREQSLKRESSNKIKDNQPLG